MLDQFFAVVSNTFFKLFLFHVLVSSDPKYGVSMSQCPPKCYSSALFQFFLDFSCKLGYKTMCFWNEDLRISHFAVYARSSSWVCFRSMFIPADVSKFLCEIELLPLSVEINLVCFYFWDVLTNLIYYSHQFIGHFLI